MAKQNRPAVVTIMGHVDHGKTTLLDYIRKTKVQAGEAGGITQHIGAYQIDFKKTGITFIDTPGHAAFNKMRERGAQITDIVVLVVAANDGVKPQTIESIRHIKNSNVSVIVAINKTDLKDVYPDVVKGQLAEHGILVQGFGGDVEAVNISAKTGKGVDSLLETISITAELLELEADPVAPLEAVVIESTKDQHRGPVATVIVQQGTLSVRQDVVADDIFGRVRSLQDETGKKLKSVGPGSPAEIIGLKDVPPVGSSIRDAAVDYAHLNQSRDDVKEDETKEKDDSSDSSLETSSTEETVASDEEFMDLDFDALFESEKPKLKLIIKADVEGTLEAIMQNLDDESVELIDYGVGEVTEGDVEYAQTSGATILAFHTTVKRRVKNMAKQFKVKIKEYDIIYKLIEDLQKQMLKLLDASIDEVVTGEAEILEIFEMKGMKIAGCRVKTGQIKKTDKLHLKRNDEVIADPVIGSMMHGKEEITEVTAKSEFGMTFKNKKLDFRTGDFLVAYYNEDEA